MQQLLANIRRLAREPLDDIVRDALQPEPLDAYRGCVRTALYDEDGDALPIDPISEIPRVTAGALVSLHVFFEPDFDPDNPHAFAVNGAVVDTAVFDVAVEATTVDIETNTQRVQFAVRERSRDVEFWFTAPLRPETHELWVCIYQKKHLVQSVPVTLRITDERRS